MKLLLDTHIVLWFTTQRERLTAGELGAILDPDNEIGISTVSIWELRIKWNRRFQSGLRKGPFSPEGLLGAIDGLGLAVMPLLAEHCAASLDTPLRHNDPFDDLLLTIAQVTGSRLLTRDSELRGHPMAHWVD